MEAGSRDLTKGSLPRQILLFTLPVMGSFFIQQLYNSADLIFAGNLLGKSASAAIGASSLLINCMIGLFTGLSVATGILYGRMVGAGGRVGRGSLFYTAIWISLIGGALLTVAGYFSAVFLLRAIHIPAQILETAGSYLRIYFLGLIPMILYNMVAGMIRAQGNSRLPMMALALAGSLNIALAAVFLLLCGFGLKSLAWATMIAQSVAAVVVCGYFLLRVLSPAERSPKGKFRLPLLRKILLLGLPVGIQNTTMTLSNIFIQYHINHLGVDAMAAFAAYYKIETLLYYPILSFGQAALFFISQNLGVGNMERVKGSIRLSILLGLATVVPVALLLLGFGRFVFVLFNPDGAVIAQGLKIIWVAFPFYWIYVFLEVFSNAVRAVGKTMQAMLITLLNFCLLRILLLAAFSGIKELDIGGIAMVYPLTWVSGALCLAAYWYKLRGNQKINQVDTFG